MSYCKTAVHFHEVFDQGKEAFFMESRTYVPLSHKEDKHFLHLHLNLLSCCIFLRNHEYSYVVGIKFK